MWSSLSQSPVEALPSVCRWKGILGKKYYVLPTEDIFRGVIEELHSLQNFAKDFKDS